MYYNRLKSVIVLENNYITDFSLYINIIETDLNTE